MPLTKRQFELGIDEEGEEIMRLVYQLLDDNRDLAYSSVEIEATVKGAGITGAASNAKFLRALEVLAEIGAIEKGDIDETDYYAFLQDFDSGTWYSAKHTLSSP